MNKLAVPLAYLLATVITLAVHYKPITNLDVQRSPRNIISSDYDVLGRDTEQFCEYMLATAEGLRHGKLNFPVGDFDCPPSFLIVCGSTQLLTQWPVLRVLNLFALVCIVLNVWACLGFIRSLGAALPLATVAAIAFGCCNYVVASHREGQMQNIQMFWIVLIFWATRNALASGSTWKPVVALGIFLGMQVISSPSYTLYLVYITLPLFVIATCDSQIRSKQMDRTQLKVSIVRFFVAGIIGVLVSAFYLIPRLGNPAAVQPIDIPAYETLIMKGIHQMFDEKHPQIYIGWMVFTFGILAIGWAFRNPTPTTTGLLAALLGCVIMMVPPATGTPYRLAYDILPQFDRLRVPLRFFPIAYLMLLSLIALHLTASADGQPRKIAGYTVLFALAVFMGQWLTSPWLLNNELLEFLG